MFFLIPQGIVGSRIGCSHLPVLSRSAVKERNGDTQRKDQERTGWRIARTTRRNLGLFLYSNSSHSSSTYVPVVGKGINDLGIFLLKYAAFEEK